MSGIEHILDFAQQRAYLRADGGLLVVEGADNSKATVPFAEIAAVVLAHPQVTISRGALSSLAEAGAVIVTCDERFMPISMTMPLTGYHAPARRMMAQINAPLPVHKRLWQQIVKAKIHAQATLLEDTRHDDFGLRALAGEARSGDPDNCEGQAARVYWPALFSSAEFLRRRDGQDQNRFLNYGYAVLRAVTCRAICAAGLHPGLGIHHHHRENAFCLADDLMEPFRPSVDRLALAVLGEFGADAMMDKAVKGRLLEVVKERFEAQGEERTLFDTLARLAGSVGAVFAGAAERAVLPDFGRL